MKESREVAQQDSVATKAKIKRKMMMLTITLSCKKTCISHKQVEVRSQV